MNNTILDKGHSDLAHCMLAPSRTCVAQGTVYVHHYKDCNISYGIYTHSMQAIENYDHGTIKADSGYAFIKHRCSYPVSNITRIYILSQRCKRYSVYYDTRHVTLVIYDKLFSVSHYPCQLIQSYGTHTFESVFPMYVVKSVYKEYATVKLWQSSLNK